MILKLAAATAMIVAAAATAEAATTITPGSYQGYIYVVSSNDPNKACAGIGLAQGRETFGIANVRGAGKPMYLNELFTYTPPGAPATSERFVFVDYVFHNFPQTISDPVTYNGPARGNSPLTEGISLRWTDGTLNTIGPDQFKLTASKITVTRDKKLWCTASIDAVFLATGF